jgi:3-isopropylmalate dehydrogenase
LGIILSAAMMLPHSLEEAEAAGRIDAAVDAVLTAGLRTVDTWSDGTSGP